MFKDFVGVRRLTVVALLVASGGFMMQELAGVTNTPKIPAGLVVLLGATLLVAFAPGRWAPLAGTFAGLFCLVATVVVGAMGRLIDPDPLASLIGIWIMVPALVVATVGGVVASLAPGRRVRTRGGPPRGN